MMIIMSSRFRFRSGGCSEGGLFVDGENVAPIWGRWTNDFFHIFLASPWVANYVCWMGCIIA
jgi:hypothetical protein